MVADQETLAASPYPSPPNYSSPPQHQKAAMSSSLSPNAASQSSFGGGSPAAASAPGEEKSPLDSLNLGFLKNLTDKRTTTRGMSRNAHAPALPLFLEMTGRADRNVRCRWAAAKAQRTKAGQQTSLDATTGAKPAGSAVSSESPPPKYFATRSCLLT